MSELTVQATWVAGLAILAVTLAGWRKPARAAPPTPPLINGAPQISEDLSDPHAPKDDLNTELESVPVVITAVPLEPPTTPLRRIAAGISAVALSMITGAVVAIILSFAAVIAVIWATNLLGR